MPDAPGLDDVAAKRFGELLQRKNAGGLPDDEAREFGSLISRLPPERRAAAIERPAASTAAAVAPINRVAGRAQAAARPPMDDETKQAYHAYKLSSDPAYRQAHEEQQARIDAAIKARDASFAERDAAQTERPSETAGIRGGSGVWGGVRHAAGNIFDAAMQGGYQLIHGRDFPERLGGGLGMAAQGSLVGAAFTAGQDLPGVKPTFDAIGKAGGWAGRRVEQDLTGDFQGREDGWGEHAGSLAAQAAAFKAADAGLGLAGEALAKTQLGKGFRSTSSSAPTESALARPTGAPTEYGMELPRNRRVLTTDQFEKRGQAKSIPGYEEMTDVEKTIAAAKARGEIPRNADAYVDEMGRLQIRPKGATQRGPSPRLSGQDAIDARGVDPYSGEALPRAGEAPRGPGSLPLTGRPVPEPVPQPTDPYSGEPLRPGNYRLPLAGTPATESAPAPTDSYSGEPLRAPGGRLPLRGEPAPPEPTPETHPELFDDSGLRRTRIIPGGGMRRGGSQSGALRIPSAFEVGAAAGRMARGWDLVGGKLSPPVGAPRDPNAVPPGGSGDSAYGRMRAKVMRGRFDRNIESFRDQFGTGGQRMSDALGNIEFEARKQIGDLRKGIDRAYSEAGNPLVPDGLTSRQMAIHRDLDLWVSEEQPTPSWAKPMVEEIRASMKRQPEQYENPAGVRITEDGPNGRIVREVPSNNPRYVPGGGTRESIESIVKENIDNEAAIAQGDYKASPLTKAWMAKNSENPWTPAAREAAQAKAEAAQAGRPQRHETNFIESMFPGAERAHHFNWPREMQNPDKLAIYTDRISKGAYNSSEHAEMGYRYDTKSGDSIKTPGKFEEILKQIARDGGSRDIAEDRALRILRRDPHGQMSEPLRVAQQVEGLYTTGSKLAGSVMQPVQQFGQIGNQFIEGGLRPLARGLSEFLPRPRRSITETRARGDIQPDNYLQSMDLMSEGAGNGAMRGARAVIKGTQAPQQMIDTASRAVASEGASAHYEAIQRAYGRGGIANRALGRDASWADRALLRLDLPMEDRIAVKNGTAAANTFAKFRQAWTRYTNNESGIPEFPRVSGELGSDPRLQWARRFTSWSATQARVFKESVVDEALHGNLAPAVRATVATIIVGEMVHKTRDAAAAIRGFDSDRQDIRQIIRDRDWEGLGLRLWDDAKAAGTLGMWTSTSRTLNQGPTMPPAIETGKGFYRALRDSIGDEGADAWWKFLAKEFPQVNRWTGEPK